MFLHGFILAPMLLQYASALHLEFPANRQWLAENPIQPEGDILVLAGDTRYLGRDFHRLPLWDDLSKNFRATYVLPGNHEYYRSRFREKQ